MANLHISVLMVIGDILGWVDIFSVISNSFVRSYLG